MIDNCINLSETAIDALKESIIKYQIKGTKGENIEVLSKRFKYSFKRLENNNAVTRTLIQSLFSVFQTSSVDEFNSFFSQWERSNDHSDSVLPSYSKILDEAEYQFTKMRIKGTWSGVDQEVQGSAFMGNDGGGKPNPKKVLENGVHQSQVS